MPPDNQNNQGAGGGNEGWTIPVDRNGNILNRAARAGDMLARPAVPVTLTTAPPPSPYLSARQNKAELAQYNKNKATFEKAVFLLSQTESGRETLKAMNRDGVSFVFDDAACKKLHAGAFMDAPNKRIVMSNQADPAQLATWLEHEARHGVQTLENGISYGINERPEEAIKISNVMEADSRAHEFLSSYELANGSPGGPANQFRSNAMLDKVNGNYPEMAKKAAFRQDELRAGKRDQFLGDVFEGFYDEARTKEFYEQHMIRYYRDNPGLVSDPRYMTGDGLSSDELKARLTSADGTRYLEQSRISLDNARHMGITAANQQELANIQNMRRSNPALAGEANWAFMPAGHAEYTPLSQTMAMGVWRDTQTTAGTPATVLDGLTPKQIQENVDALRRGGFHPDVQNTPGGEMIVLHGDEAALLREMRIDYIGQHAWQAAGDGAQLPTKGMRAEESIGLVHALQSEGLSPAGTVGPDGYMITIPDSAGAAKIREFSTTHFHQASVPPPPPPVPVAPSKLMAMGVWKEAMSGSVPINRIPTAGMTPEQINENMETLRKAGFNPKIQESSTLGPTIRLEGDDAMRMSQMRREYIATADWRGTETKAGMTISRVPADGMTAEERTGLVNALGADGITAYNVKSAELGETIRVAGADVARVQTIQREVLNPGMQLGPHAPPTPPTQPRPLAMTPEDLKSEQTIQPAAGPEGVADKGPAGSAVPVEPVSGATAHGLTPEQINRLAESIAYHSESHGHLKDFNVKSREELVEIVRKTLSDPKTEFIINRGEGRNNDAVVFYNNETKTVVAFNPIQLNDPPPVPVDRNDPDNFAGTVYREPKLNEQGQQVSKNSGRVLTDAQADKEWANQVKGLKKQIAKATNVAPEQVVSRTIGESDEWATHIGQYDEKITEGMKKGVARVNAEAAREPVKTAPGETVPERNGAPVGEPPGNGKPPGRVNGNGSAIEVDPAHPAGNGQAGPPRIEPTEVPGGTGAELPREPLVKPPSGAPELSPVFATEAGPGHPATPPKVAPIQDEVLPGGRGPGAANTLMGLGIAAQAIGELTGPNPMTTGQKVTLVGQASTGLAQMGLEYAGPSFNNLTGTTPKWNVVGNDLTGDVTALGRLGGGLGALGGGFGLYASGKGLADSISQKNTLGIVLNGGNLVASGAFTVGGVAQILGDASLAADSTGVGLAIGVPLQVVGVGFQIYEWRKGVNEIHDWLKANEQSERQQAEGGPRLGAYKYVPGVPLKPEFKEYRGLTDLAINLRAYQTKDQNGQAVVLQDHLEDPRELDAISKSLGDQYDNWVQKRKEEWDESMSWRHTSYLGRFSDYLRKELRDIDDPATIDRNIETIDHNIEVSVSGRAAQRELDAGPPPADGSRMAGYNWRMEEYQRRLKPLEAVYGAQVAELNKLADIYKIEYTQRTPTQKEKEITDLVRQRTVDEHNKVEAMKPAEQEAYFKKNKEFIEKAGLTGRRDLAYIGLSTSRAEYNTKAAQFAPALLDKKAQQAVAGNAATLRVLGAQEKSLNDREKQMARLMPEVRLRDMPVMGPDRKPVVNNGKQVKFADVQTALVTGINDARAKLAELQKDPKAATDPDLQARIKLQTVAMQTMQIQYANNVNANLSYKLQAFDKSIAALAKNNADLRKEMADKGLDKVAVTPNAEMQQANETYVNSLKAIQEQTQAIKEAKEAFDQKFGDQKHQEALLKKKDPAYIAEVARMQSMEFNLSMERVKAMRAENAYLKNYEKLAAEAAPAAPAADKKDAPQTGPTSSTNGAAPDSDEVADTDEDEADKVASNDGDNYDDVVADGGVRNRDGTAAERGELAANFNPNAEGETEDGNEDTPAPAGPGVQRPAASPAQKA